MMNDTPDTDMASRTTKSHTTGSTDTPTASKRVRVPSDVAAPGKARLIVREMASGLPDVLVERAELAVSELVTNAVRHGADSGSMIDLEVDRIAACLTVAVSDPGRRQPAAVEGAGGFGLDIVRQVSDELSIEAGRGWTVRAVFVPRSSRPGRDDS